ncbi:MAG: DUF2905 domain-containing protein [Planctomycetaceae bacterium]|nr:DUF2905 domain-containing protein [Planctomycetaceae bacterium]
MQHPGWTLLILGGLLAVIGAVWLFLPSLPWLGKLPGGIALEGKHFRFYFPLATSLLLSLLLTGLLWLIRFFSR